jgi:murein DD-endopeptidase MepM/ murein hydrolase activator NlpD
MKAPFVLTLLTSLGFAASAQALEVRFYPGDHVYAYELDPAHGARSINLHNIAIINDGAAPVTLTEVDIQLMSGDHVLDSRMFGPDELTRAAGNGVGLQQQNLLGLLAFQFGGEALIGPRTRFSADLTLDPGEAIMINSQVFAYRGARDSVRVRVNGDQAEGRIAIRTGVSHTAFSFPLRGAWYNANGASFHTGHRWSPMEEFGFDLVKLGPDFRSHRRNGTRFADYFAYGQPVLAAADGRVVSVVTDQAEDTSAMQRPDETADAYMARLQQDQFTRVAGGLPAIGGNHVVIDHGDGEFSFYAHLRPGSVGVHVGDAVTRGQRIGDVGSSGNSTEPHLHFQVCDSANALMCAGIPVNWQGVSVITPDPQRAPQTGDFLAPTADLP